MASNDSVAAELRRLVKKWRSGTPWDVYVDHADPFHSCADELEQLLDRAAKERK